MRSYRVVALAALVTVCAACPGQTSTSKATVKPTTAPTAATTEVAATTLSATSGPSASVATTAPTASTITSTTAALVTAATPVTTAPPAITTAPPTTAPPTTAPPTTPAPAPNPCSNIDFQNFTYNLPDWGVVTVTNGQGERGTPSSDDYIALQVRAVVVGDIGGADHNAETAVFTNANTGGTGQLSDVHIFTCTGKTATRIVSAGVGDRADDGVRAISMANGQLFVDRFTDGAGACCPGAAVRQPFTLAGSTLSVAGPGSKRRFLSVDGEASQPEIAITFLPGTSGALIFGDTATARPGGLNATAGQTFSLVVEPAAPGLASAVVDLVTGSTVVGSATSGHSMTATLPVTGHYQLKARPATAGTDAGFDAEITIT